MTGHVLPLEAELPADQGVGERRLSPTHCFPSCGQTLVGYMAAFWKFVFDRDRVGVFDTYTFLLHALETPHLAQVLELDRQDPRHTAPWDAVTSCRGEQAEEPRQVLAKGSFLWAASG